MISWALISISPMLTEKCQTGKIIFRVFFLGLDVQIGVGWHSYFAKASRSREPNPIVMFLELNLFLNLLPNLQN